MKSLNDPVQTSETVQRKNPIWVSATGRTKTRIAKAKYYLKHKAWVPDTPLDGDKAMLVVCCNLRRYHKLCAETTVSLIREHYNPRCVTVDGSFWGWHDQDIQKKYRQAGMRGMYPTLGVEDPKALAKAAKMELIRQLKAFWKKSIIPGGCCTPAEFRKEFIRFRGGKEVTPNMLSRVIKEITGIEPVRPFGKKIYRGFHIAVVDATPEQTLMAEGQASDTSCPF